MIVALLPYITAVLSAAPTTASPTALPCATWCAGNPQPWATKCTWGGSCAGCEVCSIPPPSPPAAPPLPPHAPLGEYARALYVDPYGSDGADGASLATPLATLRRAAELATPSTAIFVASGTYRNAGYGSGNLGNGAALSLADLDHVLVASLPGHAPRIQFDGSGGISVRNVSRLEARHVIRTRALP